MDPTAPAPAVSPNTALLLAVLGLVLGVVGPALVALIQRGGKAAATAVDPHLLVARSEFEELQEEYAKLDRAHDRLIERVADLDHELLRKGREADHLRQDHDDHRREYERREARLQAERDLWLERAMTAGYKP